MKSMYKKMTLLGLMVLFLFSANVFAQDENIVTGKVFPMGMQTPMRDVTVQIEGDDASKVLTDGNGMFQIEVPSFPVKLVFIREKYERRIETVNKAGDITVYLIAGKAVNAYGQEVGLRVKLNTESRDGILTFASDDKRFRFWFDNRVYLDGAMYFGDNTYQGVTHEIGNGVNIRRMRFAIKTVLWGHWGGEIDFDFGNNEVDIKDAYIKYMSDKNWRIKAGHFREPMSMSTLTTSRYITFIERSYPSEQAPSRHMGIDFKTFTNHIFFEGGIFSSSLPNVLIRDQNKKKGTNAGWSLTGRFAWAPIKKERQVLHLGLSGSYRVPKIQELGDPINSFRYGENAETEINRKKYIDTDWIPDSKTKVIIGTELAYAVNNFRFQGEYLMTKIQRDIDIVPEGEDKIKLQGFYLMGSWIINNADYYYNMSDAEFSQIDFRNFNKGAFEIAFRYSYMNTNNFKDGELVPFVYGDGGSGEVFTLGLNYFFNYNVKLMLNYAYVNHDRWADDNGKHITYDVDDNGNDITPTGKGGIDFHTLSARILIAF